MRAKSANQKKKEGTLRNDRQTVNPGEGLKKLPAVPPHFDKQAAKSYKILGKIMIEKEVLHASDIPILLQAAKWFALLETYSERILEVDKKGNDKAVQIFQNGTRQISPEFTVFSKAQDMVLKFSKLFGLTPYDRERIAAYQVDPETEKDPFEALFGKN